MLACRRDANQLGFFNLALLPLELVRHNFGATHALARLSQSQKE
jgi:hypothetical protein